MCQVYAQKREYASLDDTYLVCVIKRSVLFAPLCTPTVPIIVHNGVTKTAHSIYLRNFFKDPWTLV